MGRKNRRRYPEGEFEITIENLSHDGRGVAHRDGKTLFIPGTLVGERVRFRYSARHRRFDLGCLLEVLDASPDRVEPRCPHVAICGGCSLQHQSVAAQIRDKQQVLLEACKRIGKVEPGQVLPPLIPDQHWGYRKKARLGVKWVAKKGRVLVGFREKGSGLIADIHSCAVLDARIGQRLDALSELIGGLSIPHRIAQIEVAIGDGEPVLVLRNLEPLTDSDQQRLCAFAQQQGLRMGMQPAGPESILPLCGAGDLGLDYCIPQADVRIRFQPSDFTQVNSDINRQMIAQALALLDPGAEDRVLDLFCGLGNFSLPLARRAGQVVGVEGDAGLVQRARQNAQDNGLANVAFYSADLYAPLGQAPWLEQRFSKALLDPPRSGAAEVLELLPRLGVERLVYVSCYPATLARDAGVLVHQLGYRLVSAGVMDMFPHTAHVESIALFQREG
ncbi:MAG: 23S rRNA (uracil(1939)-C(5))-methyltransferase RlmD [Gammaproteobacteria bacterium SHHR-1]|uniref:23S rRNA (uracil(1939)-C(5))-methyltransferase RlmD n=1 Tax=Magnetovirga frankeli TaxID=947516 RepID=UPI00129407D2|nr:23S rRNA (uracil(1939)-C(5))-methyltransferase RlmD [gamma proteobacterium SS-5]